MKIPRYTDKQRGGRYRTAAESREPGYLKRRFKALSRLNRMRARKAQENVQPIKKTSNGR